MGMTGGLNQSKMLLIRLILLFVNTWLELDLRSIIPGRVTKTCAQRCERLHQQFVPFRRVYLHDAFVAANQLPEAP